MALMTLAEKNSLVKNRLQLLDNVHLTEEFYSSMMADHSLTESMIEEIRSMPTNKKKVGRLLDLLSRRSQKAFHTFIRTLVFTDHDHVAQLLNRSLTDQYVRQRDSSRAENGQYAEYGSSSIMQASSPAHSNKLEEFGSTVVVPSFQQCSESKLISSAQPSSSGNDLGASTVPSLHEKPHLDTGSIVEELLTDIETFPLVASLPELSTRQNTSKGVAFIIVNRAMDKNCSLPDDPTFDASVQMFFEKLNYQYTQLYNDYSLDDIKGLLSRENNRLEKCKSFVFYFLGFGDTDSKVAMPNGERQSIYSAIVPLFNSINLPSLGGKPKLLIFHLAEMACKCDSTQDDVDAGLTDPCWTDMIIFQSRMTVAEKMISESRNLSDFLLPFHALVKVVQKFADKTSVADMLREVGNVLKELNNSNRVVHCSLNETPLTPGLQPFCFS